MKTDVWMPLYVADYLADTTHLTTIEHGAYLLLIMAYWRKGGPLPDDDKQLSAITRTTHSASLSDTLSEWSAIRLAVAGFFEISHGIWVHHRIEKEIENARRLKEAKSAGAKATNSKKVAKRPFCDTHSATHSVSLSGTPSPSPSPSPSPIAERDSVASVSCGNPTLNEVLGFASSPQCGVSEWKATDWFNEMEGCGWLDHLKRPVANWKSVLLRVKTKWEADGRPSGPPSSAKNNGSATNGKPSTQQAPSTPYQLNLVAEAKQKQMAELKLKHCFDDAMGAKWSNEDARKQYVQLKNEIKTITGKIASLA